MSKLVQLRKKIDSIDRKIVDLLDERADMAKQIGDYKRKRGLEYYDPARQKMILARVFEQSPKLILANQPTRGLDMGAAAEVARRLLEARENGAGVVLISEDLDEVLSLSDRIMVIHDGELREAGTRDREEIGLMMAGEAA